MRIALKVMALVLLVPMAAYAANDPWAGTWKLNMAKSKFPGTPPQTEVLTISADGTLSLHEVTSKGENIDWTYKPIEGQPVQVMGRKGKVMVTVHHITDPKRRDQDWDNNGKPGKSFATVSADGKTQSFYALDDKGEVTEMVVYEKQ